MTTGEEFSKPNHTHTNNELNIQIHRATYEYILLFLIMATKAGELGNSNIYSHFETGSLRIFHVVSLTAAACCSSHAVIGRLSPPLLSLSGSPPPTEHTPLPRPFQPASPHPASSTSARGAPVKPAAGYGLPSSEREAQQGGRALDSG